ncbi:PA1571 family protein [Aquirhabdus parva]|jgi:hypothetical protein|uniref:Uncharacterized protein n=1 Tax=Aquirhabdus parva TaxID=2283318 RepID=A0A345P727_9GAMM|nr:PA1571 family protein [Aquirhabdus parva]AXI03086.1 hypothetical protein HYN46_09680 [Aquirhabdus parva]
MQQSVQSNSNHSVQVGVTHMQAAYGVCHLVDEQGREIKITEAMILDAFASLKKRCCNQAAA